MERSSPLLKVKISVLKGCILIFGCEESVCSVQGKRSVICRESHVVVASFSYTASLFFLYPPCFLSSLRFRNGGYCRFQFWNSLHSISRPAAKIQITP
jgi:hypothetical protein